MPQMIRWHNWRDEPPELTPQDRILILTNEGEYITAQPVPGGYCFRKIDPEKPYIGRTSASFAAWTLVPKAPRCVIDDEDLETIPARETSDVNDCRRCVRNYKASKKG